MHVLDAYVRGVARPCISTTLFAPTPLLVGLRSCLQLLVWLTLPASMPRQAYLRYC